MINRIALMLVVVLLSVTPSAVRTRYQLFGWESRSNTRSPTVTVITLRILTNSIL